MHLTTCLPGLAYTATLGKAEMSILMPYAALEAELRGI